jgi:hypothetical protein
MVTFEIYLPKKLNICLYLWKLLINCHKQKQSLQAKCWRWFFWGVLRFRIMENKSFFIRLCLWNCVDKMSHMCRLYKPDNREWSEWITEGWKRLSFWEPFSSTTLHFLHTTMCLFSHNYLHSYSRKLHPCINDNITTRHNASLYVSHREPLVETGVILKLDWSIILGMLQNFIICYRICVAHLLRRRLCNFHCQIENGRQFEKQSSN